MSGSKGTEKQYGLINMKKTNTTSQPLQKKLAIFDESDEEETPQSAINQKLQREAVKTKMRKQTKIEIQKALEEDPTVFEYDSIYDDMEHKKQERERMVKAKQRDSKPKYIAGLMKAANQRKMERERQKERKIQKEREKEGEEFGDKEQFVTASYKKKMQELAEDEERERREAERDGDVTKNMDMTGFYRHILEQTTGGVSEDNNKVEVKRENPPVTEPKREKIDGDQVKHTRDSEDRDKSVKDKEDIRDSRDNYQTDNGRHQDERHRRGDARDSDNRRHIERDYRKDRDKYRVREKDRDREKDRGHKENRGDKQDRKRDYDRGRERGRSDEDFKSHDKLLDRDKHTSVSGGRQYGGSEKGKHEGQEQLRDKNQKGWSSSEKKEEGERDSGKEYRKEETRLEEGNEDADSDLDISEESEDEKDEEVQSIEEGDKQLEDKTKLKYAKRTTTDSVMSARDRYLARKKQRDTEKAHIAVEEDD